MTTTTHTLARLRDLHLPGMAQALTQQTEQPGAYDNLPFLDRLALLVESECLQREQRKQDRLIRQARFKLRATLQDIDYEHPRNLQRKQLTQLAQGEWLQRAHNLLITGPCVDQWYATIGDNTLADAILDRLVHNAHRLTLKGESMRKKQGFVDSS